MNGLLVQSHTEQLKTGQLIPNFSLPAVNRDGLFGSWDYKQHRNLVLIFPGSADSQRCRQLLSQVAKNYGDYREKEAEVLTISSDKVELLGQLAQELALPFPVLFDRDGKVTDLYLKDLEQVGEEADFREAIIVADRWGAIFNFKTVAKDQDMPAETEIRSWLEFIELQCEECFPPEWPL